MEEICISKAFFSSVTGSIFNIYCEMVLLTCSRGLYEFLNLFWKYYARKRFQGNS